MEVRRDVTCCNMRFEAWFSVGTNDDFVCPFCGKRFVLSGSGLTPVAVDGAGPSNIEALRHSIQDEDDETQNIAECRRLLQKADAQDKPTIKDETVAYSIGSLIIAIEQLALVVEDLASREQGKVIA